MLRGSRGLVNRLTDFAGQCYKGLCAPKDWFRLLTEAGA